MRVVLVAMVSGVVLAFALPALAQEDEGRQEFCDWYWNYEFDPSGGMEYWCWDSQWGEWYSPSEDESFLVTPAPGADAAALDESALSEERPEVNEKSLVAEQGPTLGVVESEGVADTPAPEEVVSEDAVPEDAVPAPPTTDQTDEQSENTPGESTPATTAGGGIAGFLLGAYDNPKAESGLLGGFGIIAALITATLMAWRLPIRRYVEQAAREPSTTSSDSYSKEAESPAQATLTRSKERLRRVRYLRSISQKR